MNEKEFELLPCPFCGGEAHYWQITEGEFVGKWFVSCDQCGNRTWKLQHLVDALHRWNTRYDAGRSQWVAVRSVDDLPKGGKEYLVTVDDDSVDEPTTMLAHWLGDIGPHGSFLTPDHYHADIGTVTAYMPVPAPYRTPEDKQS